MRLGLLLTVLMVGGVIVSCSDDATTAETTPTPPPATTADATTSTAPTTAAAVPPTSTASTVPPTSVAAPEPPATTTVSGGSQIRPARIAFNLPDGFTYPEGVALDPTTGRVYVTSVQTGAIAVAEPGSDSATVWLPAGSDGRKMPTLGIEFGADRVWIVSMNALYEYRTDGTFIARHDPDGTRDAGLNDVAITDDGAYVTDSSSSLLWYLPLDARSDLQLEPIDIDDTSVKFDAFNGIEALPDGTLLVNQFIGNLLFHVDPRVPSAVVIDLDQALAYGGDGMSLDGNTLWVVNAGLDAIDRVELCPGFDCGTVTKGERDPMLSFPTDVQVMGDVVLVVNSQMRHGLIAYLGDPTLPFTVAAIPLD